MSRAARLNLQLHPAHVDREITQAAIMVDMQYIGLQPGYVVEEARQHTGPIIQEHGKPHDSSIAKQPLVQDPAQERTIHIAAADDQYHLAASGDGVFDLPNYNPELNPDERLNADLKHAIGSKVPVRTKAKLHAAATDHMATIEADPDRVKSYFQDPRVKYAA